MSARPEWTLPTENLGRSRLAQGDSEGAVKAFIDAQEADPDNLPARYRLARLYERLGNLDGAVTQYEGILERWPHESIAANNLAMLLVRSEFASPESYDRALALAKGFSEAPQPELRDTLAWVHLARGETRRALEILRQVVTEAPETPTFRYHLAMAQLESGQQGAARTNLEQALAGIEPFEGRTEAEAVLARLRG
jgi:Flp pilus assembly protein TadD